MILVPTNLTGAILMHIGVVHFSVSIKLYILVHYGLQFGQRKQKSKLILDISSEFNNSLFQNIYDTF